MLRLDQCDRIVLPQSQYQLIIEHCRRKMAGEYLPGETQERKAFGLLAGKGAEAAVKVAQCFPLLHNGRFAEPYRDYMDRLMGEHATPSVTPMSQRGWIADPAEMFETVRQCRGLGLEIIGAYHMHRVAWPHDLRRETPTRVDTMLAAGSRNFMFIVSMVKPEQPVIRAFYEGELAREVPIAVIG